MKFLVTMFTDNKDSITAEKLHREACHEIVEMGYTHVYDEVVNASSDYRRDIKTATTKGALIGAATVCLIGVGALGYNKFLNYRRLKKINKEGEA